MKVYTRDEITKNEPPRFYIAIRLFSSEKNFSTTPNVHYSIDTNIITAIHHFRGYIDTLIKKEEFCKYPDWSTLKIIVCDIDKLFL